MTTSTNVPIGVPWGWYALLTNEEKKMVATYGGVPDTLEESWDNYLSEFAPRGMSFDTFDSLPHDLRNMVEVESPYYTGKTLDLIKINTGLSISPLPYEESYKFHHFRILSEKGGY